MSESKRIVRWDWRVQKDAPRIGWEEDVVLVEPDVLDPRHEDDSTADATMACVELLTAAPRVTFLLPTRHPTRFAEMLGSTLAPHPLPSNIVPALYVERAADLTAALLDQLGAVVQRRQVPRRALVLAPREPLDLFRVESSGRDTDRDWIAYTNALAGFSYAGSYRTDDPEAYTRRPPLDLVVVAGGMGAAAPPMHPAWLRLLRDQTVQSAALLFAGWGTWVPSPGMPGDRPRAFVCPACGALLTVAETPEHQHGTHPPLAIARADRATPALLDGRTHLELPGWL